MHRRWSILCQMLWLGPAATAQEAPSIEQSVVRILTHVQERDLHTPWDAPAPQQHSGTGFVVEGGLVMTNAHVVSNARMILIRLHGHPTPRPARVHTVGHDCDLALVEPLESQVLEGVPALELGSLPEIGSAVETYGYPIGGQRISSTRGVVSRIERTRYVHSEIDDHLAVQTDAAINPGNSGGPVMQAGKVVGVSFQAAMQLENVAYFIPTDVIRHFLADVSDGAYDGFPDLGISTAGMENPAARRVAGMDAGQSGVRVDRVSAGGSCDGVLREGDVLTAIDGYDIANDGTIAFDGLRLHFGVIADRRQVGEHCTVDVLRDGEASTVDVPMVRRADVRLLGNVYDARPRYFVYAGLVFVPLSRELVSNSWGVPARLDHELFVRPLEEPERQQQQVVVLLRRLDHRVNRSSSWYENMIVERVNGVPITGLESLISALESNEDKYQVIEFGYHGRFAVLDREEAEAAHDEILARYGVPVDRRL